MQSAYDNGELKTARFYFRDGKSAENTFDENKDKQDFKIRDQITSNYLKMSIIDGFKADDPIQIAEL